MLPQPSCGASSPPRRRAVRGNSLRTVSKVCLLAVTTVSRQSRLSTAKAIFQIIPGAAASTSLSKFVMARGGMRGMMSALPVSLRRVPRTALRLRGNVWRADRAGLLCGQSICTRRRKNAERALTPACPGRFGKLRVSFAKLCGSAGESRRKNILPACNCDAPRLHPPNDTPRCGARRQACSSIIWTLPRSSGAQFC
jgi:hypothetical protein